MRHEAGAASFADVRLAFLPDKLGLICSRHDPLRRDPGQGPGLQPADERGPAAAGLRLFGPGAQGASPAVGRALPGASAQRRLDPGGPEGRRRLDRGRPAPRRARGHAHDQGGHRSAVRWRGGGVGGRPDQDLEVLLRLAGGRAGRNVPKNDPGDGVRPAGRPRQARRPSPQHADPAMAAGEQAAGDRAGDHGHLRSDRQPSGNGGGQDGAGRSRVSAPGAP